MSITQTGYFKHPNDDFVAELRVKDLRSAKEWDYVYGGGVPVDVAKSALNMVYNCSDPFDAGRRFVLWNSAVRIRWKFFRFERSTSMTFLCRGGTGASNGQPG